MAVTGTVPRSLELYVKSNGKRSTIDPALSRQVQVSSVAQMHALGSPSLRRAGGPDDNTYAPFALEITQPQAGLNINNRFYRAYPGLLYSVIPAVIGGAYPYTYSLDTAPSGMSINSATGEITWSNPVTSGSPHSITLRVVDNVGTPTTVSWTLTVTTTGFMFVDAAAGSDANDGSIGSPKQTFNGVYGGTVDGSGGTNAASKDLTVNQHKFAYFKNGTYLMNGRHGGLEPVQWTANQPLVWMVYPGHTPAIDYQDHYVRMQVATDNFYVDGFEHINCQQRSNTAGEYYFALRIDGASNRVTLNRNNFHGMDATGNGSNNPAFVMFTGGSTRGTNSAVQYNNFADCVQGYGVLGYSQTKMLVHGNIFSDFSQGICIGPKDSDTRWHIRKNQITNVTATRSIWLNGTEDHQSFGLHEVSFNYGSAINGGTDESALHVYQGAAGTAGGNHVFRNTFVGDVIFKRNNSATYFGKNVIQNAASPNGITFDGATDGAWLTKDDSLWASSGLVDGTGNLTAGYAAYVGSHGWQ